MCRTCWQSVPAELEPATAGWCRNSYGKGRVYRFVRRLIGKEHHQGQGFESFPLLGATTSNYDVLRFSRARW
jgi:hypothetical protein